MSWTFSALLPRSRLQCWMSWALARFRRGPNILFVALNILWVMTTAEFWDEQQIWALVQLWIVSHRTLAQNLLTHLARKYWLSTLFSVTMEEWSGFGPSWHLTAHLLEELQVVCNNFSTSSNFMSNFPPQYRVYLFLWHYTYFVMFLRRVHLFFDTLS